MFLAALTISGVVSVSLDAPVAAGYLQEAVIAIVGIWTEQFAPGETPRAKEPPMLKTEPNPPALCRRRRQARSFWYLCMGDPER